MIGFHRRHAETHHSRHSKQGASYEVSTAHTAGRLIHWARRYDLLVWALSLGQERRLRNAIADLAALQPGESALDVGCGTGTLALVLAERVGHEGMVAGVDPSPEMIARARTKARKRNRVIDFRQESAAALSWPDQNFDVAVSSFAIHHLTDGVAEQALAEVARVLKPGGRVCLVDFLPAERERGVQASTASGSQLVATLLAGLGFENIETGALTSRLLPGMAMLGYVRARRPQR